MQKHVVCLLVVCIWLAGCAIVPQNAPEISDVIWPDYRQPLLQYLNVFQYGHHEIKSATITVELPEEFLIQCETLTLLVDLESRTEEAFKWFSPFLVLNRALFNTTPIPVKDQPYRQVVSVPIACKQLKTGTNRLQARFAWKGNFGCSSFGCGYIIHQLAFNEALATHSHAQ